MDPTDAISQPGFEMHPGLAHEGLISRSDIYEKDFFIDCVTYHPV